MVPTKERPGSKAISMRKELKTGLYFLCYYHYLARLLRC